MNDLLDLYDKQKRRCFLFAGTKSYANCFPSPMNSPLVNDIDL